LHKYLRFIFLLLLGSITQKTFSQSRVGGTVFDMSRTVPVKGVMVNSNSGNIAFTDSLGHYSILISNNDSLWFTYGGKSTTKFSVGSLPNYDGFDVAIHVTLTSSRSRLLPEVRVYGRNYKFDSLQNRIDNARVFGFDKSIQTGGNADGVAGFDLNSIIGAFRFRHNKNMEKLQQFLMDKEQQNYVDYRFNKRLVRRITLLDSAEMEKFMKAYRPSYEFATTASDYEFHKYILQSYIRFKGRRPPVPQLKPVKQ
jgi:plasmid maintenance system killer protein